MALIEINNPCPSTRPTDVSALPMVECTLLRRIRTLQQCRQNPNPKKTAGGVRRKTNEVAAAAAAAAVTVVVVSVAAVVAAVVVVVAAAAVVVERAWSRRQIHHLLYLHVPRHTPTRLTQCQLFHRKNPILRQVRPPMV